MPAPPPLSEPAIVRAIGHLCCATGDNLKSPKGNVEAGLTALERLKYSRIMMRIVSFCSVVLFTAGVAGRAASEGIDFFEQKIRPVLVERCYECHSAQSEKLKGELAG